VFIFWNVPYLERGSSKGTYETGASRSMAIYRLFKNSAMEPDLIARLSEAYERTLRTLCLVDRNDPLTEMIAEKIIEIGQTGVKEPAQISELAIKDLGIPR
jgi:hypothetical protein